MDELKKVLKANPRIESVYFDDNGQWCFFPNPNFPNRMPREDVMKLKAPTAPVETSAPATPVHVTPGTVTDPVLEQAQKQAEADAQAEKEKAEAQAAAQATADAEIARIEAEELAKSEESKAQAEAAAQAKLDAEKTKIEAGKTKNR